MRKKAIILIISAVVLAALAIFGCVFFLPDPPIGSKTVTDLDEFGKYNKYVKNMMADEFQGSFPTEISDEWSDVSYFYQYNCALFGDPSFCLDLQIRVENTDQYRAEVMRVYDISYEVFHSSGIWYYIILPGIDNDIRNYIDDEVHDGQSYRFEIVLFDDSDNRIEYLTAYLWDNAEKISYVDTVLRTIAERKEP